MNFVVILFKKKNYCYYSICFNIPELKSKLEDA